MINMANSRKLTTRALKELQDILQKNAELLNTCDFEKLYDVIQPSITSMWYSINVGDLTYILVQSGIDPLKYMNKIPTRCFYKWYDSVSIVIPNNIKSIQELAFWDCRGLTSITIPDSVTSIGDSAFWGCSGLTSITIPDSITSISRGMFSGCSNLTNIVISDKVTSINEYTFENCNSLKSINYLGTKSQWDNIDKATTWRKDSAIKVIKCSDGNIKL